MILFKYLPFIFSFNLALAVDLVSKDGCGTSKGCYFVPAGCDPARWNCLNGVTYKMNHDMIEFELFNRLPSPASTAVGRYTAIGFGHERSMLNAAVTYCVYNQNNGQVISWLGYNPQYYTEPFPASNRSLIENQLKNTSGALINDTFVCRFSQRILPPSNANNQKLYPLDKAYYLLLATGNGNVDPNGGITIMPHVMDKNSEFFPKVSDLRILTSTNDQSVTSQPFYTQTNAFGTTRQDNLSVNNNVRVDQFPTTASGTTGGPLSKNGCGTTKGCFFEPPDCDPSTGNCISGVTFVKNNDAIDFELFTQQSSTGRYVAVGFSKDNKMGDDAVTYCIYSPSDTRVFPWLGYNPTTYSSAFPVSNRSLVDNQLRNINGVSSNGIFVCRFSQKISSPSDGGVNSDKIFPLDRPYYLLLAVGDAGTDQQGNIDIRRHNMDRSSTYFPKVTGQALTLSSITGSGGGGGGGGSIIITQDNSDAWKIKLIYAHEPLLGSLNSRAKSKISYDNSKYRGDWRILWLCLTIGGLMLFGWWLLVACAILFARYFKTMLDGQKLFGIDIWFHFHRGLNIFGIVAIISAFVCVLVAKDGIWIGRLGVSKSTLNHAILGLAAFIGLLIQPIMAIFRCDKHAPKRPIFNWIHRFVGLTTWGCASAAIWMTTEFYPSMQTDGHYGQAPRGLIYFYWAVLGVVIIGLEIWITLAERIHSRNVASTDIQMRNMNGKSSRTDTTSSHCKKSGYIRGLLLLFFIIIAIAVTVTLTCFVVIN